jgi:hypothetical protein
MMAGRYAHAKQFNRHHRQVRFLRTRLGRLIRDIRRKIAGHQPVEAAFESPLSRASRSDPNASANAAGISIPSMHRRSSASAKAKPVRRSHIAGKASVIWRAIHSAVGWSVTLSEISVFAHGAE